MSTDANTETLAITLATVLERQAQMACTLEEIKENLRQSNEQRQSFNINYEKRVGALEHTMRLLTWFSGLAGGAMLLTLVERLLDKLI